MYKILILGSSGFIGRNLSKKLNEHEFEFLEFNDKYLEKNSEEYSLNLVKALSKFYENDKIIIINCMGITENNFIHSNPGYFKQVSINHEKLHVNVFKQFNNIFAYFFLSSGKVYRSTSEIIYENTPTEPITVLGKTKLFMEKTIKKELRDYSTKKIILRLFNVYGADQKQTFLIPYLMSEFKTTKSIINLGNIDHVRSFIFIEDVIEAILTLIREIQRLPSINIYNIGGECSHSIGNVVKLISDLTNQRKDIHVQESRLRPDESDIEICSVNKLKELGWEQKLSLHEGLEKMSAKLEEAVILAGGYGSRLLSQGITVPKILLNINGRTLLENHLIEVKKAGLKKVIFMLGSGSDQILNQLSKINESEVQIDIIIEEEPKGTTNAILSKIDHFSEKFILIYGDLYHRDVLKNFCVWCEETKNYDHAISGRWTDHPKDSNCFLMDDENLVLDFIGKKNNILPPIYGMSGLAMLNKDKLIGKHWHDDFEEYLFKLSGQRVKAFISNKLIYDCGTVERINNLHKKFDSLSIKKRVFL